MNRGILKGSRGLSLIETVIALGILTTGMAALVGTAIYSFSNYNKALLRLTAMGLAREGVEVAKNIRDTNWLPPQAVENCGVPAEEGYIGPEQYCYKAWLTSLDGCSSGCQAIFVPATNVWSLQTTGNYSLYRQADGTYTEVSTGSPPLYYRKLKIIKNTAAPYSLAHPELQVLSTVAWVGRGCISDFSGDPEGALDKCKITIEDRLTNWKNY